MMSSIPKWLGDLFERSLRPNMTILGTSYISPSLKKIRFQGNRFECDFQIGYANVIRVSDTEYRNYTVAHQDTNAGILDIIFHIHGQGVGSHNIDSLQGGDQLYISPPRGKRLYDPSAKQQLIFGDETSLGPACSLLPVLRQRGHQFGFYFELDQQNKHVPQRLGLENSTVFPKNGSFSNEAWLNGLPILQSMDWQAANFILTGKCYIGSDLTKGFENQ